MISYKLVGRQVLEIFGTLTVLASPLLLGLWQILSGLQVLSALFSTPFVAIPAVTAWLFILRWASQGYTLPYNYRVDMSGKRVIVTGGNSGIGLRVATTLAKWGAHVVIGCRNAEAAQAAVEAIIAECNLQDSTRVTYIELDLSSLESVRRFAARWQRDNPLRGLDLLVNNAGIMMTPFGTTKEGIELQFGTNHVGHFLLTHLLIDALKMVKGRVVNVSSLGHMFCGETFDLDYVFNPVRERYDKEMAYGWSKSANILHARELTARYGGLGVNGYSVHPGLVNTNLTSGFVNATVARVVQATLGQLLVKSPQSGADAVLFCCVDSAAQPGGYHADCSIARTGTALTQDGGAASELWERTERFCGLRK